MRAPSRVSIAGPENRGAHPVFMRRGESISLPIQQSRQAEDGCSQAFPNFVLERTRRRSAMTQRTQRHTIWAAGALLLAALSSGMIAAQAPAQNNGGAQAGIKAIAVASGGTIYLGALAGQPTPEDAMGKVMTKVTALCGDRPQRSEEHTSELQSLRHL